MTADSPEATPPCAHPDKHEGLCPSCGACDHDVVLNGACLACGSAELDPIAMSPKKPSPSLVPADRLRRRQPV
jgi:hypothetical protein